MIVYKQYEAMARYLKSPICIYQLSPVSYNAPPAVY